MRSPSASCASFGQAAGVRWPHAVGAVVQARGFGTGPLVCLPCWALHAAGTAGGCPGGGAPPAVAGGVCALPLPAARPWGGRPGLGVGVVAVVPVCPCGCVAVQCVLWRCVLRLCLPLRCPCASPLALLQPPTLGSSGRLRVCVWCLWCPCASVDVLLCSVCRAAV